MDRPVVAIVAISIIILGGIIIGASKSEKNFQPRSQCIEHSNSLAQHIHPQLAISIDSQAVTIPANVGISATCMMALHTHDDSGTIHIESPEAYTFTLGDFFANWGQTFSKDQILDKKVDATHEIKMTVDGQPSTEYEKLNLKDLQKIQIDYVTK